MSSYGVMRGLYFLRPPFTQSKLVRCVKGRVITSITLRLMGVSLSWMNRLGIELPIGSRGMGGRTKISQQEITKFMAKIMRDQERI